MNEIWTQDEEAERLLARFKVLKNQGIGQAEFARHHKFPGGASMLSQIILGRRPMTLEHATIFAEGFKCGVEEISPRLAAAVSAASKVNVASGGWPFPDIDEERFSNLTPNQKIEIQGLVRDKLERFEESNAWGIVKPNGSTG